MLTGLLKPSMDLLVGTMVLRPYVFAFLAVFLVAGAVDLGWRRVLGFAGCVWPVAWLAEFSSTRTGIPFGLYTYTQLTRGRELFLADVPVMDSLSFTFLAYASFCLARVALAGRAPSRPVTAVLAGSLMMALDVVIDPLAVRGDRWFLGHLFFYPEPGVYFGVPLSNFAGWVIVGTIGVGFYLALIHRRASAGGAPAPRRPGARTTASNASGGRAWPGVALYYGVLGFNLAMTILIGEWWLAAVGAAIHLAVALVIVHFNRSPGVIALGPDREGIQRA
jgi:putative membrane protein